MNSQDNYSGLRQFYKDGLELHEQGRFSEAVLCYQKVLDHIPDADLINYNLGLALYELARYSEAVVAFSLAARQNRQDPDYWFNLGLAARHTGQYAIAQDAYKKALALQPGNPDITYNIGCCYRIGGELEQAVTAFEKTVLLDKNHASALSNLACCLHRQGDYNQAAVTYRRLLELRPGNNAALHLLAALTGYTPASVSQEYVSKLFDDYSADFDRDLLENLEYRVPELLRIMVAEFTGFGQAKKTILDLGCGTGLSGLALVDFASVLTGIDLSEKMIAKAKERGCYDTLVVGDVVQFMTAIQQPLDMLIAADVLTYMGELEPLFKAAAGCLGEGGIFCFSTERSEKPGYHLRNTGRYAHHLDYIDALARRSGFKMLERKKENIRRERGQWIIGDIYLLAGSSKSSHIRPFYESIIVTGKINIKTNSLAACC
jgi:predicted TPR repeat methyltransferase